LGKVQVSGPINGPVMPEFAYDFVWGYMTDTQIIITTLVVIAIFAVKVFIVSKL